jgi:N6-L-threonylcarbamoyladenine synthase
MFWSTGAQTLSSLSQLCADRHARLIAPPPELCTDNAAMIAWAGIEHLRRGATDGLDFAPRPRWPLEESRSEVA